MKDFPFKKIDVFATPESDGNPAAVIRLDSMNDLSEREMQEIASELGTYVTEVGYLVVGTDSDLHLRYFSAEREVDFCGHATIGILHDLLTNDPALMAQGTVSVRTNRGVLEVENRLAEEGAVFIESPQPKSLANLATVTETAKHLGTSSESIDRDMGLSVIDAGLATLLVPIKNIETLLAMSPEFAVLKGFCETTGVDIVEVFTADVSQSDSDYRVRVFAPTFGYLEDPATGSGNSALGHYLMSNGIWPDNTTLTIEQNGDRKHPNIVKLRKRQSRDTQNRVTFGGAALVRITGAYRLHSA